MANLELLIEELRVKHGLTLVKLAELSGVSRSTLSEIKLGTKTTLSSKQEKGLAKAFNVKIIDLYREELK